MYRMKVNTTFPHGHSLKRWVRKHLASTDRAQKVTSISQAWWTLKA